MSADSLKTAAAMAANQDTPANVLVPNTLAGIIAWMVGRVGPTAALAIIMAVYLGRDRDKAVDAAQLLNSKVLEAFTARTSIETEHVSLLRQMQLTLVKIDDKLDREKRSNAP